MMLMGNVYFRDITVRPVYEDRRYYEGLLSRDEAERILNQIIPSVRVREYILNKGICRRGLQEMIWHSPAPLKVKAEIMHFLTEREEGNLDIRYEDTGIERDSLTSVRRKMACVEGDRTAREIHAGMWRALQELNLKPGEIFCLIDYWCDTDIGYTEERFSTSVPYLSIEPILDYIRAELYLERDGDCLGWYVVEKWRPGENGRMENPYTYLLIEEEIVYYTKNEWNQFEDEYDGYWGENRDDMHFWMPDPYFDVPFQVGDIVTMDARPFVPLKHTVLLETGSDCCALRGLYRGEDGLWYEGALRHRHGWDMGHSHVYPRLSPLYRMTDENIHLCEGEELLIRIRERLKENPTALKQLTDWIWEGTHSEGMSEEEILKCLN